MIVYLVWNGMNKDRADISRFFPSFIEAEKQCMLMAAEHQVSWVARIGMPVITKDVLCDLLNGRMQMQSWDDIYVAKLKEGRVVGQRISLQ